MKKKKINNLPMVYPIPIVLVGSLVNERPNYVTLGNCGIISVHPSVIYISSHKSHYTNKGILENNEFSINIPSANIMDKVDYCGLVTGSKIDKSTIFKNFYSEAGKIPMIEECPINMECKVIKTFQVYDMEIFIGQVKEVYADEICLMDEFPITNKVNPLIYSMDNNYWNIGEQIGEGFCEGKSFRE